MPRPWKPRPAAFAAMLAIAAMSASARSEVTRNADTIVPLREEHGILYLSAEMNGVGPFTVVFDPGAGDLYTSYARIRLKNRAPTSVCLGGACFAAAFEYFDGAPNALDPKHDLSGGEIAGSIGPALLQRYAATIDYRASTLTLVPTEYFSAPPKAHRLPLWFDAYGLPVVQASVNGITGDFELDVRARRSMLFSPFAERTKLPHELLTVRIGGYDVGDTEFLFSTATSGKFANGSVAGLLGNNVFSHFVLTLDLPRKSAYLVPQRSGD